MKNRKKSKANGCSSDIFFDRRIRRRHVGINHAKTISGRAAYERALANEAIILGENKDEHAF